MTDDLRLIHVQVTVQVAREEDGEVAEMYQPVAFAVSPADWKKGWDWRGAFVAFLAEKALGDEPPAID